MSSRRVGLVVTAIVLGAVVAHVLQRKRNSDKMAGEEPQAPLAHADPGPATGQARGGGGIPTTAGDLNAESDVWVAGDPLDSLRN